MNLKALREELESDPLNRGYSSMTDQQAADDLNAETISEYAPVPVSELKRFFFVEGVWQSVRPATDEPAGILRDALAMFDSIRMDDPQVRQKVEAIISGLVSYGHMTEAQKTALLFMGVTSTSRARQLNILGSSPQVGPAHIAQARAQ